MSALTNRRPATTPMRPRVNSSRRPASPEIQEGFDPLAPSPFRELVVTARDGHELAARSYEPLVRPVGAVFIAPAMAVPQSFYEPLSRFLAGHGFAVLTFDYRGLGESRRRGESLRRIDIDVVGWAERDVAAALAELRKRVGDAPITWLGHSLGGQIVPLVPNHGEAQRIITIATGSGYWRQNSPALRKKVPLFWYGFVPVLTPLFGYFPGARLGLVGDLPRGVIRQWRRWCLHPDYLMGELGEAGRRRYAALTTPLTSLSFTDDEMMSAENIASLHAFYAGATPRLVRLTPGDLGVERVGHFGAFKPAMREPLWERHLLPELARRGE